ncbi:MAG: TetR/AcrR family transcriptional regulator [Pseudomonadota bacterium]
MARARPYDRQTAIDAATQLFWEKGFVGTSLKDLEHVLSMKPGSIYAAFKSKEALYLMALDQYFTQSLTVLNAVNESDGSLLSALSDVLRRIGKNAPDDPLCRPCMVVKTLLETATVSAEITDRCHLYLNNMIEGIKSVLDMAQAKGELPADVDTAQLARRYQANLTALRLEAHVSQEPGNLDQLANDMAEEIERFRYRSEIA